VLAGEHELIAIGGWHELIPAVRSRPVDVAIVDPLVDGVIRVGEVQSLLLRYRTLPVVVYTVLTPETLKATVELANWGVQHVVLRGFDDEPRRFRSLLDRLPAYAMADTILAKLSEPLAEAPGSLAAAVRRLFQAPHSFRHVCDLAEAAGMTRRNLDRWLDRIGLAPARTLLVAARLVRAYHYTRDPGYLLGDVATKLGYSEARIFAHHVREATGLLPSVWRRRVRPENFVAQLTVLLCRRGDGRL
jgi:AraC-like DNA-binding protein